MIYDLQDQDGYSHLLNLSESRVVEVSRVAADTGDDDARLEERRGRREGVVVDQPRGGVHLQGRIYRAGVELFLMSKVACLFF